MTTRRPPPVDLEVLLQLVARDGWALARSHQRLSPAQIEALLAALESKPELPWGTFLRTFMDGADDLEQRWKEALAAILDLNTSYTFNSQKHRTKLAGIVADPRALEAVRATAAVATGRVPRDMLAVLLLDGRKDSLDALIPSLHRAVTERDDELDQLLRLARIANHDPLLQQLLDNLRDAGGGRRVESPVMELARSLFGDDCPPKLHFSVSLCSAQQTAGNVSLVQSSIHLDSEAAYAYQISISELGREIRRTQFNSQVLQIDQLELGRTELDGVPDYLERAGRKLEIDWRWGQMRPHTSLRGKKRDVIPAWLRAGSR